MMQLDLTPNSLLTAYAMGIFPMADEEGAIHWLAPDPRAVIELDKFKASRSLRTVARRRVFEVSVNRAFPEVIEGWILNKLNTATRQKLLRELPEAFAAAGNRLPEVSVELQEATRLLLRRLRAKVDQQVKAPVGCKYTLTG